MAKTRAGWRQWREDEARTELALLRQSGMSKAAYARQRGVSLRRLDYWAKRLRDAPTQVEFAALVVPPRSAVPIEIVVGDVVVRVPDGVGADRIAELVVRLADRRPC